MRRSWHALAIGNGIIALVSIVAAVIAPSPGWRWMMIGNAIGSAIVAAWALRKDDGAR